MENTIQKLSELLDIEPETVTHALAASWVKEDSFVPVKTIPKVSEPELMSLEPDEKVLTEKARQDALLALPGVMFTDVEVRYYETDDGDVPYDYYICNVKLENFDLSHLRSTSWGKIR